MKEYYSDTFFIVIDQHEETAGNLFSIQVLNPLFKKGLLDQVFLEITYDFSPIIDVFFCDT